MGRLLTIFFFQAEDGIRDIGVTGVQTCALPISSSSIARPAGVMAHTRRGARGNSASSTLIAMRRDRKSTRLNSSHANISYAVFCLKKKKYDIDRSGRTHVVPASAYHRRPVVVPA